MDNNTHSAIIELPGGSRAFIDGIPDECDHDWTGDPYYVAQSGKVILWHTYRQWAHLTNQARYPLIMEHHRKIDDPILESGVTCRKCKKFYHPPMY